MKYGIARCAAAVALAVTAGLQPASATLFTCVVVQRGDTAASLALRLTGDAANRHEPWFQILDPAASRFISKAEYDRIEPGWRACLDEGRVVSGSSLANERGADGAPPMQPRPAGAAWNLSVVGSTDVLWGVLGLLVTLVAWRVATRAADGRRTLVPILTVFGERFIREFERPLRRPGSGDRALESRLRFTPRLRRLDILLAPRLGRTYPNLSDHRKNVEYDVGRVLQGLGDERFVSEQLSAQGRWVIVRCRFNADL
jgi:hypothetical protein